MTVDELMDELNMANYEDEVVVEVNGVQHILTSVQTTSQGVALIVDLDEEEKGMR